MLRKSLPLLALLLLCGTASARSLVEDAPRLLPPPPAAGSPKAQAELEELRLLQKTSTKEQLAAAAYDDLHEDGAIFTVVLGPGFDMAKLPATKAMLDAVGDAESEATKEPKAFFHRDRPYIVDSAIKTCTTHKPGPAANSYPSGHTTVGFAMAVVMAALVPEKAQPLLARATLFGENRLVCGYHFRSDIVAGQELGTILGLWLLEDADFKVKLAAAKRELQAAQIIR